MAGSAKAIRPLSHAPAAVREAVLRLNQAHVAELSTLQPDALDRLIDNAFRATVIGEADAFLIAFAQDADYDSPNFGWFKARLDRFVYIDRIAVAPSARGQGLAGLLYRELMAAARSAGQSVIVCEVNVDPPNPGSDAFHDSFGFREVGRAKLPNGKTVRYLAKWIEMQARGRQAAA